MVSVPSLLSAQTNSFQFLKLPGSARLSALGGVTVSAANRDVNYFQSNPALAGDTINGWGAASYLYYFANIGMSNFSYQHKFNKVGSLAFGIQHVGYGRIQGYDAIGTATDKINVSETALFVGKSHRIGNFQVGANLKSVFSNMAGYRANAILVDLGGVFIHPKQDLKIGLVIKNLGVIVSEYSATSSTKLPFDIQAGVSLKPEHMPMRFTFTAHDLTSFDISYYNPTDGIEKSSTLEKVVQHLTVGSEILIGKNINLLMGYNFLRHRELKSETFGQGSGLSLGALFCIKSMELAVSRAGYVNSGSYQVSLSVNIQKLVGR
jgi:hypothetical protein